MSAPLAAPGSENLSSKLAKDWAFQVNTSGDKTSPTWEFVLGLNQFSPTTETTTQDDGDINSGGYGSQIATLLALSIEVTGLRKGTDTAGAFTADPGQAYLEKRAMGLGVDNFVHARYWRTDGVDIARDGMFTVQWAESAEGKDGLAGFTATLNSRGKPMDIEKPKTAADNSTPSTPKGGGLGG